MSTYDQHYHTKIRPLLDVVDELRSVLQGEPIKIPSVVCVGDQSAGKSSVLEALSGVSLPRGQNITTRCPLILRMIDAPKTAKPYATIGLSIPSGERIDNLQDVGTKIEAYTTKIAGQQIGVSSTPIYLSVYRAGSAELTLVDLPGITRNPVGDQPKDIYALIKKMIHTFIVPEESVILVVMPAMVDFSTCEGIMMAKEVDPSGARTIGVVSKIDMAEKGIRQKLEAGVNQLGLRLGLVAVRNRTHEENEQGLSWETARELEKKYFSEHPEFAEMKMGTGVLGTLLATIQHQRIKSTLPTTKLKIRELLLRYKDSLKVLPHAVQTASECRLRFDQLFNSFLLQISTLTRGDHTVAQGNMRLHLSPRLAEFYKEFYATMTASASPYLSTLFAIEVENEIKENNGVTLPNFLSQHVFKALMLKEITALHPSAQTLIEQITQLLSNILLHFIQQTFAGYPPLVNKLTDLLRQWIQQQVELTTTKIVEVFEAEDDIFTLNSAYMDFVTKIKAILYEKLYGAEAQHLRATPTSPLSKVAKGVGLLTSLTKLTMDPSTTFTFVVNDVTFTVDLANLTLPTPLTTILDMQINAASYATILHKRLGDVIPMTVRYHMVKPICDFSKGLAHLIQEEFQLWSDLQLHDAMKEDSSVAQKRGVLLVSIARLEKAMALLDKF